MRCAAPQIRGDAEDELSIHCRRVRRREIVRDQNVRRAGGHQPLWRFALKIAHDAPGYVLNVERALAQIWVVDLAQRLGVIARDFLKDPFDVAALRL